MLRGVVNGEQGAHERPKKSLPSYGRGDVKKGGHCVTKGEGRGEEPQRGIYRNPPWPEGGLRPQRRRLVEMVKSVAMKSRARSREQ